MKRSRFSEEQIIAILKEHEAGHLEKPSDLGVMAAVWTAEAWQGWRGCAFWGDFHVAGAVG